MAKQKNPLGIKEQRLTAEQYEDALVKYAKLPPDVVDETEFRRRLEQTTVLRYRKAGKLLDGVEQLIKDIAKTQPGSKQSELKLAIKKLDLATVQMTHGALGFNKGAVAGVRNLLQITRARRTKS